MLNVLGTKLDFRHLNGVQVVGGSNPLTPITHSPGTNSSPDLLNNKLSRHRSGLIEPLLLCQTHELSGSHTKCLQGAASDFIEREMRLRSTSIESTVTATF